MIACLQWIMTASIALLTSQEPAMRRLSRLAWVVAACALGACSLQRKPPPTAASVVPLRPIASLQELMQAEVDSSADGIWNAVETVTTRSGTEERQPRTSEQWTAVRNAAITLVEATNLLVIEGRRVGASEFPAEAAGALDSAHIQALIAAKRPVFDGFAAALRGAGLTAMAAIDARDPVALVKAGGEIDQVCEACHLTFWYPNQVIPAISGR
jgi:hypothetical protein